MPSLRGRSVRTERSSLASSISSKPVSTDFFGQQTPPCSPSDFAPTSILPPPSYADIFPPTPPASAPSSPCDSPLASVDVDAVVRSLGPANNLFDEVFPADSAIHALPSRSVDLAKIHPQWTGVVLDNPDQGTRTLYVAGGSYEDVNMRESVCAVLELAEDDEACTGVVMCLEKSTAHIQDLIHALLYVGGTITNLPFPAEKEFILVGLDL